MPVRFRLATLLAAVTVLSLVFALIGPLVQEYRQEERIIRLVQEQLYEGQTVSFSRRVIDDLPILDWPWLRRVTEVTVVLESGIGSQAVVTEHPDHQIDLLVEQLSRLRHLQTLRLVSDELTNAGLSHLAKLRGLEVLDLRCPLVTSTGTDRLEAVLPGLRVYDD